MRYTTPPRTIPYGPVRPPHPPGGVRVSTSRTPPYGPSRTPPAGPGQIMILVLTRTPGSHRTGMRTAPYGRPTPYGVGVRRLAYGPGTDPYGMPQPVRTGWARTGWTPYVGPVRTGPYAHPGPYPVRGCRTAGPYTHVRTSRGWAVPRTEPYGRTGSIPGARTDGAYGVPTGWPVRTGPYGGGGTGRVVPRTAVRGGCPYGRTGGADPCGRAVRAPARTTYGRTGVRARRTGWLACGPYGAVRRPYGVMRTG